MSNEPTYADGEALQQSLAASARANFQVSGVPVSNALARMIFDRFLCRVFSEPDAGFALKGGTGMLARIPLGRATQDVDLEHRTHTLSAAIEELTRLAAIDLGDFHQFTLDGVKSTGGPNQPDLESARLTFRVARAGPVSPVTQRRRLKQLQLLHVDLAIHQRPSAPLVIKRPEFRLSLPKPVVEHDYILISVEDQIADKAAAMMDDRYAGGVGSSRAKDLVDIALLALNEAIDADLLRLAVVSETERRGLKPYGRLVATVTIQKDFHRVASKATAFPNHVDWQEAEDLGNALLMPVLARTVTESTWDPVIKAWRQNS